MSGGCGYVEAIWERWWRFWENFDLWFSSNLLFVYSIVIFKYFIFWNFSGFRMIRGGEFGNLKGWWTFWENFDWCFSCNLRSINYFVILKCFMTLNHSAWIIYIYEIWRKVNNDILGELESWWNIWDNLHVWFACILRFTIDLWFWNNSWFQVVQSDINVGKWIHWKCEYISRRFWTLMAI